MRGKRNFGKHTSIAEAALNIVSGLERAKAYCYSNTVMYKSAIAYNAYPDYDFKTPQGAAFSVAKICNQLEKAKILRYHVDTYPSISGYQLTGNYQHNLVLFIETIT